MRIPSVFRRLRSTSVPGGLTPGAPPRASGLPFSGLPVSGLLVSRFLIPGLLVSGLLVAEAVAVPAPAGAQEFPTDDPVIQEIWELGMVEEASRARPLAQTLMDSIGPRLTGTPQFFDAADWTMETLEEWGIPARRHEYGTWLGWERGHTHLDLLEPRFRTLEGTILAWSPGTDGPVEGEAVLLPDVRNPGEFEAWLPEVEGKFVAFTFAEPTCRPDDSWEEWATEESFQRMRERRQEDRRAWAFRINRAGDPREVLQKLEEAGALGILTSRWSEGWGVNKVFSSFTEEIPSLDLSCEDYGLVFRLAKNGQGPVLRLDAHSEFNGEVPAFNVIGEIPGAEKPDEYVVLSAHLDTWDAASGATDNGTGVVTMMEAMRILSEVYPEPKRTIVVGLWGGEEQGLIGSAAYVEDHPEVLDGLQVALNQDNGTWRVEYIRMQGLLGVGQHFARWLDRVPPEIKRHIELDIPGVPEVGGSDHMSFLCEGAPGMRLQSSYPDYRQYTWHTNRDTFDKIIFDDLRNNATLTAMLAYLASEDPERVPRERRVMPVENGEQRSWPGCPTVRRSWEERRR